MDQEQELHRFVKTHDYGRIDAVELQCPQCGRHVLYRRPPNFSLTVIVEGDIEASHTYGEGGLEISGGPVITPAVPESTEPLPDEDKGWRKSQIDRARLKDWDRLLKDINFDDLWE